MSELLIKGGRVLDPARKFDAVADVLCRDGLVEFVGDPAEAARLAGKSTEVLDASGLLVTPGLIDMHVHFREPGNEQEETIASGSAAAAAGGFTSVACMPNTDPAIDSEASVRFVKEQAARAGLVNVFPVGAITAARAGKDLSEMGQMARSGAVAFSDDGSAVPDAALLRRAMSYAKMLDRPILEHCEDRSLAAGGSMHEGFVSTSLGLQGIPAEAEEIIVARDAALAHLTGARLHIQHVSTAGSVAIIKKAKADGVKITAEVCPHHLVLTDEAVRGYNPDFKVNPPLRTASDVRACVEALCDGTIDAIASDHAPHLAEEKELEFDLAPCGVIGLETTVGVLVMHLVNKGLLPLARMIEALTVAPAAILGLGRGSLSKGLPADVTVLDLKREWTVEPARFRSKSRNCPYAGTELQGAAAATVVAGRVAYKL